MCNLTAELQGLLGQSIEDKMVELNKELESCKSAIRSGSNTDEDIARYNSLLDQLVLFGSNTRIPDEFWGKLSCVIGKAIEVQYPDAMNGTSYIRYRLDKNGFDVKEILHQKRGGRPPTTYELEADGEVIKRTDFLLQYCQETDSRISWSRVRAYAKDLVSEGVFSNVSLYRYNDTGEREQKWSVGVTAESIGDQYLSMVS